MRKIWGNPKLRACLLLFFNHIREKPPESVHPNCKKKRESKLRFDLFGPYLVKKLFTAISEQYQHLPTTFWSLQGCEHNKSNLIYFDCFCMEEDVLFLQVFKMNILDFKSKRHESISLKSVKHITWQIFM